MAQNPFYKHGQGYLAGINNAYKSAEVSQRNTLIPEGKYQCYTSSMSLDESKYVAGELNLTLHLTVLEGDMAGRIMAKYYPINEERMDMLKGDMMTLGVNLDDGVEKLGEADFVEREILDKIVDVTVKHKKRTKSEGVYMNIYLNRCAGKVPGTFEAVDDDDNPFLP